MDGWMISKGRKENEEMVEDYRDGHKDKAREE